MDAMPQPGRPLIAKIICPLSQVLAVSRLPPPPPLPRPLHQASASFDRSKVPRLIIRRCAWICTEMPSSNNADRFDSARRYRGS